MQVLVTGATSFIGRALIPLLQREGHSVVAWVRSEARARSLHSFAADGERTVMEDRVYYAPPLGMFRLTAGCSQGKRPPERAKLPSASRPACLTRHGDHAVAATLLRYGSCTPSTRKGELLVLWLLGLVSGYAVGAFHPRPAGDCGRPVPGRVGERPPRRVAASRRARRRWAGPLGRAAERSLEAATSRSGCVMSVTFGAQPVAIHLPLREWLGSGQGQLRSHPAAHDRRSDERDHDADAQGGPPHDVRTSSTSID